MGTTERRTIPPTDAFRDEWLALQLPYPAPDANKYSRGKLVAFAGSAQYPGAALLAADAALISGAGYVQVVSESSVVSLVHAHRASLVATDLADWSEERFIAPRAGHPCAYLVGSGYDPSDAATAQHVLNVLARAKAPVLVDGGGLAALDAPEALELLAMRAQQGYPTVLTPHAGEAARLEAAFAKNAPGNGHAGGTGIRETTCEEALARKLAAHYHAIIVLKGPVTFVCDGENLYRMDKGTAALAKAGTGDVLAGMTAAFLAQGLEPFTASALGARLHAEAGHEAAARKTAICVTAEDVVDMIPESIKKVRSYIERTISC